ncbi:PQQ-binding-like beta-propeller repeat protein [Thalassococcus sp. BH17M4-6]|uniref:outer membrane protein assembly factor BamB family protein n=1 Tax=Thalassococcus sp. BH17M4-6 TaxID=3413148 RepID=UPI003BC9A1C7
MRNLTIKAGLAGLTLLAAACTEPEAILPGERLNIRAGLQGGEVEVDPENTVRAVSLPGVRANANWPQSPVSPAFRTDNAALSSGSLRPLWSVSIGQGDKRRVRLNTDPIADGGRIYTMDSAHLVTALSTSGQVLWTHDLTPLRDDNSQAQGGGLSSGGGRIYAASGFGTVTALDPATGQEIWTQRVDNTATGAPTFYDGVVYVTSGDSIGWAIEADSGRVRWQISGVGDVNNVAGAPAPAVNDTRVIFSFGDGTLQSAFRQGGLRLWNADVAGTRPGFTIAKIDDITGDPLIDGDTVYVGNYSGRVVAFDVGNGERRWTARDGALNPVWPGGDSVYFVSDRNQLIRLDATDGSRIWAVNLPGYEPSRKPQTRRDSFYAQHGPILANGRLIVAGSDGFLRAFDPTNGALVGTTPIDGGATTRPIVAGGVLYVVSSKGQLHAFR